MTPRVYRVASLILSIVSMFLPFAWTYPFEGPFSGARVAINLSEIHTYTPNSPLARAAYFFVIGMLIIYFHGVGSLVMGGSLGYAALITFSVQGCQPASGFYVALIATLVGFYAFLRTPTKQREPETPKADYSPALWK